MKQKQGWTLTIEFNDYGYVARAEPIEALPVRLSSEIRQTPEDALADIAKQIAAKVEDVWSKMQVEHK